MADLRPNAPPPEASHERLDERLHDDNPSVRAHALDDLRDKASPSMIARTAAPLLADPDPGLRERAAHLLTSLSDPRAAAAEVAPFIAHDNITTRNLAGEVLVDLGRSAVDALAPYLRDDDHDVRKFAIDVLAQLPANRLAHAIADMLDDPDANVQLAAVDALGALGAWQYSAALLDLYADEPLARPDILHAMGQFGPHADLDLLERGLQDDQPVVQLAAAEALASQDDPEVIDLLLGQVDKVDPMARPVVLHSIIMLCTNYPQYQQTLPGQLKHAFLDMLDDPDSTYRCAAANGLAWFVDDDVFVAMLAHAGHDDELDMALFTTLLQHPAPFEPLHRAATSDTMPIGPAATFTVGLLAKGGLSHEALGQAGTFLQQHFNALDVEDKVTTLGLCHQLDCAALHGVVEAALDDPHPDVQTLAADMASPSASSSSPQDQSVL